MIPLYATNLQSVFYVSAIPEADKVELEVIDEVFCKNRYNKLMVGCVTSNIGMGEAASGINSIIKVFNLTYVDCLHSRQKILVRYEKNKKTVVSI